MLGWRSITRSIKREERVGVEARLARDFRPGDAEAFLKVFFVSDQRIEMAGNALDDLLAVLGAADGRPELGAVIEVKRGDGSRRLGGLHALDDQRGGGLGQRRRRCRRNGTSGRRGRRFRPSRSRPA